MALYLLLVGANHAIEPVHQAIDDCVEIFTDPFDRYVATFDADVDLRMMTPFLLLALFHGEGHTNTDQLVEMS